MNPTAMQTDDPIPGSVPRTSGRSVARFAGRLVSRLFFGGLLMWSALAIYYSNLPAAWMRTAAAVAFLVAVVLVVRRYGLTWRTGLGFLAAFGAVAVWFSTIQPSNDRDWEPDLAVLARAEIDGDRAVIRNVRNCDYRSKTDFTVRHEDRTYDLSTLKTVDYVISYWGEVRAMAHTFLTFGFEGGDHLAVSIEARREKGEQYGPVAGIFKQFELIYVVGDERDLIRVRTNFRDERVYLYPTRIGPVDARRLFLDYMRRVNELAKEPEFYGTIGSNCTTNLVDHLNTLPNHRIPYQMKILLNGYSDELAYERGEVRKQRPFEEWRKAHAISEIAKRCGNDPDFSRKIRARLPEAK